MSDEENNSQPDLNDIDNETLRILVSTDNHIGYCERDPIRGLDSFAAFEEVLILARNYKCDLVLLSGDLFHENKPSRRTLHKTITILRKYCMGPNPVSFQIISNQAKNFRNEINGLVNYEDEYYSVDMPIFSIHGNHDDPTRDGGTEMLAALDLLNVSNLINYFGRQDEVDKVEISPILLVKNGTRIALYGMGSIRDERLNRMWQNKKVRFLRPEEEGWFCILTLHQNRDLGRGSKNCIHESMIPEWMDLVVWGHEHECLIDPMESLVGTFRIIQPGSSVATSLCEGEAVQKKIGILDIRQSQFRLSPIPLRQVRSFAMGEVVLAQQGLDVDDPKVDEKLNTILIEKVEELMEEAREKIAGDEGEELNNAKYKIQEPHQVLVRLKVDHSGFSTVNNQRFGARFVGQIANPSDILLFHRRRQIDSTNLTTNAKKSTPNKQDGIPPEELETVNIEDLIHENLNTAEKKLGILDQKILSNALHDFVEKEQRNVFSETFNELLGKKQKTLVDRGKVDEQEGKVTTKAGVIELCKAEAEARAEARERNDQRTQEENNDVFNVPKSPPKKGLFELSDDSPSEEEEIVPVATSTKRARSTSSSSTKTSTKAKTTITSKTTKTTTTKPATSRISRAARSTKKQYTFNDEDDELEEMDEDSDAFIPKTEEDDDILEEDEPPPKRVRGFTSSKKTPLTTARSRLGKKRRSLFDNDVEEEEDDDVVPNSLGSSVGGWGTAATSVTSTYKRRRR